MYVGRLYPVFFLLITTSGTLNAEPRVYTSDELDALLDPARVERVKRQHVSSYDKSATTQVVLLKAFSSDQTDDPATEFLLFETLLDLGDSPPADSIVKIVEKLATRENRVFVLHSEGGHASVTVPAFDVAAAAQFKLAHWAESATYLKFSHALERGEFTLATYRALTPDQRRGVKLAIGQAHHRQLAGARSELVSALHAGLPVAELVADAALRLSDNALFTLALEKGQAKFLHKQLALIPASFNATDGLNLLKTATRHAPLQSMALLLMANLDVSVKSSVIDFLLERLTDKSSTASAAATLARFNDTTVNNALGKLLHDDNDVTRRGAALALHFEGSDQATTILRNFVDLPGGDSVLKRDIAKWLRD